MGPVLIHQRKTFSSYVNLPFSMIKHNPRLSGLLVTGSDGEKTLKDALNVGFSSAAHLLCDIHMEDNIIEQFTTDIFGKRLGNNHIKGLVDCSSASDLMENYQNLKESWVSRHRSGKEFASYFEKNKLDLIKETMTQSIRSMAGLGFPPEVYNQNANECMNSVLKRDTPKDKKRMSVTEFISHCRSIEKRQRTQEELAMIRRGELKVLEGYSDLCVDDVTFFRKTEAQKKAVYAKFFNANVRSSSLSSILEDSQSESVASATLSVPPENSKILSVPYQIVKEIFKDAATLVSENDSIVLAPGSVDSFFVRNTADRSKPFLVKRVPSRKTTDGNIFQCGKHCLRYSGVSLCSHVVAVAEHNNELQEYLDTFNAHSSRPNLTSMANMDMPRGRGKKASKATQKRKGPANAPKKRTLESYLTQPSTSLTASISQRPVQATPSQQQPFQPMQSNTRPDVQQHFTASNPCTMTQAFPSMHYQQNNLLPNQETANINPTVAHHHQLPLPSSLPPLDTVPKPSPPPGIFVLYLLQFCDPRVSRCYGCGHPIKAVGLTNVPPSDLVIVTKLCREYRKEGETRVSNEFSNAYFHANLQCIHKRLPHFLPSFLQIPAAIRPYLSILHRQHIVGNLKTSV